MLRRFLILIPIAVMVMGTSECAASPPSLGWKPKLYWGDANTQSIVRRDRSSIDQMYCSNPAFNKRVCITDVELRELYKAYQDLINKCEKWK